MIINKYLITYFIFLLFCYAGETSDKNSEITDAQKKKIEKLTNDMFMAPDFELNSVDGKKYKISDLRGSVIILNFWATWCHPCRLEIPDFNELYLKNKDKDLIILGVSTDDTKNQLIKFLELYDVKYPLLYGSTKQIIKISNDYGGIRALPTSVIIDRNGEIKRIYPGAILKNYDPMTYSSFVYDVEIALRDTAYYQEQPSK